jgi:nicotinate phosphoribosyltransferase
VRAGQLWNIPTFGTMAHAFVEAHDDELTAFRNFAEANPQNATLILDTYDTEAAAAKVVRLAGELAARGMRIRGVRLDSGDLAEHARRVRRILDDDGWQDVRILASGGLDEWQLAELVAGGAPIDGYGIGTRLDVSSDAPYLDCAYKLQAYAGTPRMKRSTGKRTWPGAKQVQRFRSAGRMARDEIALDDETRAGGTPLLQCVMRGGRRVAADEPLDTIRARVAAGLASLPDSLRSLDRAADYDVAIAPSVRQLAAQCERQQAAGNAQ